MRIALLANIDVAAIADAVWDEAIAGHVAAGSFGLNLDAAVSSRANGADFTQARAVKLDNLDAAITSRLAAIKSTQRGTITIPNASNTANGTITAVVVASTQLRYLGSSTASDVNTQSDARANLAGTTTVTATRSDGTSSVVVGWELTEFN